MYLLTIDIGNTTISLGVFKGRKLVLSFKISTGKRVEYRGSILKALSKGRIKPSEVSRIIVCSVVPKETGVLKSILSSLFDKKVLQVGKDIKIPIINKYRNPQQVGQDRLVNAYAGLQLFGPGIILVDFGTAVTFDIVSRKSEYLGGLIFPGLDLSLDALYKKTALLPRINISRPKSLVGRDTISSMKNGIVFGMAGACDGIIERLLKKFRKYSVIATGGNVNFIKKHSKKIRIVRPYLTHEGLRLLSRI
jgi:type III pantothenate kinase